MPTIGTWTTSPAPIADVSFDAITLRMIARISIGGKGGGGGMVAGGDGGEGGGGGVGAAGGRWSWAWKRRHQW